MPRAAELCRGRSEQSQQRALNPLRLGACPAPLPCPALPYCFRAGRIHRVRSRTGERPSSVPAAKFWPIAAAHVRVRARTNGGEICRRSHRPGLTRLASEPRNGPEGNGIGSVRHRVRAHAGVPRHERSRRRSQPTAAASPTRHRCNVPRCNTSSIKHPTQKHKHGARCQ